MSLIGCNHTLSDVTVAPGIAYTVALQRTAHRVYSRLMDLRLAPNDGSLCTHADVTDLCSNAFKIKYTIILAETSRFVKDFSSFFNNICTSLLLFRLFCIAESLLKCRLLVHTCKSELVCVFKIVGKIL